MGFFKKIKNFLAKASIPIFKFENNQLYFKLKDESFYIYDLNDFDIKTRHDSYVREAYTLSNQNIFLEYIKVHNNVEWSGQALSLYESFFKEKLNIKELKTLESKDLGHYTFKVFKVDDSFILHCIYIYTIDTDIFIMDTKGKLFKDLIYKLDTNYIYKYEKEEKASVNFNISMTRENTLKRFFYASES